MKGFIFLDLSVFTINLLSSANFKAIVSYQPYIFTYKSSNLFLIFSDGTKRAEALISGSQECNYTGMFSQNL